MKKTLLTLPAFILLGSLSLFGMNKKKNDHGKIEQEIIQQAQTESCDLLKAGRLSELDPLVGDTACQIRALEIAKIYKKFLKGEQLSDEDSRYLSLSRLLTKTKTRIRKAGLLLTVSEKTDSKLLNNSLTVRPAELFVRSLQQTISKKSVELIQTQSNQLRNAELIEALKITKEDNQTFKRVHVAAYPSFKVVFLSALSHQIPLVINLERHEGDVVNSVILFYAPMKTHFVLSHIDEFDQNSSVIMIDAISSAKEIKPLSPTASNCEKQAAELAQLDLDRFIIALGGLDIVNLLLKTFAAHPQFVGKELANVDIPFDEHGLASLKQEMIAQRSDAQFGFVRNNAGGPYTIIPHHVYASSMPEMILDKNIAERYKIRKEIRKQLSLIESQIQSCVIEYVFGFKV